MLTPSKDISRLLEIMAQLRDPQDGCAWDKKQDFASIAPYTIEEAYEVVDAIEREDPIDLCDELGDLLLQVVFHAQMASERGLFDFGDVVAAITTKMVRRHPHIFGNDDQHLSAEAVKEQWDRIKAQERADKRKRREALKGGAAMVTENSSVPADASDRLLDQVPTQLPALTQALKIQHKAASVGFDWDQPEPVYGKIEEELTEFRNAGDEPEPEKARTDEMGDLLFSVVNLARFYKIDPEQALRGTIRKFKGRFSAIEDGLTAQGIALGAATLDQMEAQWQSAKAKEKTAD